MSLIGSARNSLTLKIAPRPPVGRPVAQVFCALVVVCVFQGGCSDPTRIKVDVSAEKPRFLIHHPTWGWPFRWHRIDEFVLASDEDGVVWQLRSADAVGVQTRELAIVFGEVPMGFAQVFPAQELSPEKLKAGRTYYVGATGPKDERYKAVFALPTTYTDKRKEEGFHPGKERFEGRPPPPFEEEP